MDFLYVYDVCAIRGFCVQIRLLCINRPIIERLGDLFDVATTVVLDVIQFVQCSDESRDGCYPIRPTQQ